MFTYTIKKDGYAMSQCRGKQEAVHRIRRELGIWHQKAQAHWKKFAGVISCTVTTGNYQEVYTIERT